MSIPENMKQIAEAAEALVATNEVQEGRIISEEQLKNKLDKLFSVAMYPTRPS